MGAGGLEAALIMAGPDFTIVGLAATRQNRAAALAALFFASRARSPPPRPIRSPTSTAASRLHVHSRRAGRNYDVYSRILSRHITPSFRNPMVVPVNMPGGGGLVALNFVANAAPKDGTVLSMITQTFPMDQALGLEKNLKVDMRTLNWIGNMSNTNEFLFTAKSSPTRTLDDARRRETIVAATGLGSIMTQLAAVYNNTLGTKFKVIYGYPSGPDDARDGPRRGRRPQQQQSAGVRPDRGRGPGEV